MSEGVSTMDYSQSSGVGGKRRRDDLEDGAATPNASIGQGGTSTEPTPAADPEVIEDQGGTFIKTESESLDDGSEPDLLDDSNGSNDPFPGAGCQTVAKISTTRRTLYVNRYGPQRYPWFVMSSTLRLKDGAKEEDLPNIANAYERTLDQPINMADKDKASKKFGKKDIQGVLGLVWDCEERESPLQAVESLNPKTVKKGLDSARDRREYQRKGKRLPAYPTTYVWVKFTRPINEVVESARPSEVFSSWEVSSKYRSAFGKGHIAREQDLYHDAKRQATRFISWYEKNVAQGQREGSVLYEEFDREPTVVPRRATSPSPPPSPSEISERNDRPGRALPSIEGKQSGDRARSTSLTQKNRPNPRDQTVLPTSEGDDRDEGGDGDDDELTESEQRDMFLVGFKQQRNIKGDLSRKQQKMFEVAYAAYSMGQKP